MRLGWTPWWQEADARDVPLALGLAGGAVAFHFPCPAHRDLRPSRTVQRWLAMLLLTNDGGRFSAS